MRGRVWLQPPSDSWYFLPHSSGAHESQGVGAFRGHCSVALKAYVSPLGGGRWRLKEAGVPVSLSFPVLGGEALGRSRKDSLSLSSSPQLALDE